MVNYIQCKYCFDEDTICEKCNGSNYKIFKRKIKEMLYCVFPCLDNNNKPSNNNIESETSFYTDLFTMIDEMESIPLIDNTTPIIDNTKTDKIDIIDNTKSDKMDIVDNTKTDKIESIPIIDNTINKINNILYSSIEKEIEKEIEKAKVIEKAKAKVIEKAKAIVKKIDIPRNGYYSNTRLK